jgi:16S rRNA C967 or C1407 C5-methylase (RsmB/RsmF family)
MSLSALKSLLSTTFSPGEMERIRLGLTASRAGSFRINTLKSSESEIMSILSELGISVVKAPEFLPLAFVFDRADEYALKGSLLFREGKIYLQSLASMLPVLALDIQRGQRVLDVCAAP